jgi:hypothetical protein
MKQTTALEREASEHIRLLRKAARTRLFILGVFPLLTLGLWAALQAGDRRAAEVNASYQGKLQDLRTKWEIPNSIQFDLGADLFDLTQSLVQDQIDNKASAQDIGKHIRFEADFINLQSEYFSGLHDAYTVSIKLPYLQEGTGVNSLTVANWWPFVFIAIVASSVVLSMRERVNAVVVAWISRTYEEQRQAQGLLIQSDFTVGDLYQRRGPNGEYFVYRRSLTLQPESFLIYALIIITVYLSFAFGLFQSPASSDSMDSMLFDFVAFLWTFIVAVSILLLHTKHRYRSSAEKYVGKPVNGWLVDAVSRGVTRIRFAFLSFAGRQAFLRLIIRAFIPLIAVCALATFVLPWISPNGIPGYRLLLLHGSFERLSDYLFWEFGLQVWLAALFVVYVVFVWAAQKKFPRVNLKIFFQIQRWWGYTTIFLISNIIFHCLMLEMLAEGESRYTIMLTAQWNYLARPHYVKNSPLIALDPGDGFWLFSLACVALAVIASPHTRSKIEQFHKAVPSL